MCRPCEAAEARLEASRALRQIVEQHALADALKKAFPADPLPDDIWLLLRKF